MDGTNSHTKLDLDSAIDKFQQILQSGRTPSPDQLKKYQRILDGIAETYAHSHNRQQLSELYTIQAEIYELSGEHKLAHDARFRAKDIRTNHKRARNILTAVIIISLIAAVAVVLYALAQRQNEISTRRANCLKAVKSSAETYATVEANNSDLRPDTSEYKQLWQSYYDTNYRESSKECYN